MLDKRGRGGMRNEHSHQIRMPDSLWNLLGEIAQELGYGDGRGSHSTLIREMVAAAAAKWRYSPYVCRSARHTVLVTKEGDVFYRTVQVLKLNSDRQKLPCFLEMKPEKKVAYQEGCPEGHGQAEWIRKHWLLNYFSAWRGPNLQGRRLAHAVDRGGADSKMADLPIDLIAGRFVTREIVAGIRDYVQWDLGSPGYDRADLPIDIPTYELEVNVAVDEGVYAAGLTPGEEIPHLALEFRNRETARFQGKDVALLPDMHMKESYGRAPDDEGFDVVVDDLRELETRLAELAETRVVDGPVIGEEERLEILKISRIPKKFLFFTLKWQSPHLGLEACVRWEKPFKANAK